MISLHLHKSFHALSKLFFSAKGVGVQIMLVVYSCLW